MSGASFSVENYITIPGFAIVEHGLSGNELICYSLVWGFTQDGETEFYGSLRYIASAMNITKGSAYRILNGLIDKGLVFKTNNEDEQFCRYKARRRAESVIKMNTGCNQNDNAYTQNDNGGVIKMITPSNNNIDKNKDKIEIENAPTTGQLFEVEKTEKKPRKKPDTIENLCLFADSKFYDYDLFAAQFTGPEYQEIDISYYYGVVGDWSASKGAKKKDWIALTRIIMRKDKDANKLHLLPKNVGYGDSVLSPEAIKYLEMGRL